LRLTTRKRYLHDLLHTYHSKRQTPDNKRTIL
jgi:hypothetical protein